MKFFFFLLFLLPLIFSTHTTHTDSLKIINLNKTTLNISLNHIPPFCALQFNVMSSDWVEVVVQHSRPTMEIQLLQLLQDKMNFNIKLNFNSSSLQNQRISEMIRQVVDGESSFALCDITRSIGASSLSKVEFSHFTYVDPIVFLSRKPGMIKRNWIAVQPFSTKVWFAIILSLILLSYLISQLSKSQSEISYSTIIIQLYGMLLKQHMKIGNSSCLQWIISCWLFASITLSSAYSGVFFSLLSIPYFHRPLDTIDELRQLAINDQMYLITSGVYARRFTHAHLYNQDSIYYELGEHLNRSSPNTSKGYISMDAAVTAMEHYNERNNKLSVLIHTRLLLSSIMARYGTRKYHIASEFLNLDFTGLITQKKSPLMSSINLLIKRAQEHGFTKIWRRRTFRAITKGNSNYNRRSNRLMFDPIHRSTYNFDDGDDSIDHHSLHKLTFTNLTAVFYLWIVALICSIIYFIIEILMSYGISRI